MTTIDDIKTSISELSDDEIYAQLKEMRRLRRITTRKTKSKPKAKLNVPTNPDDILGQMSQEQLANLIAQLEAK